MPLIQRLLALLIVLYRRWLSGRGPLRNVRCSFAPDESCSAYGLRVARESSSARTAVGRIARRLRRCRDAWLITDGRTMSWTPLHDRSADEITTLMQADGERGAAIARMLHTRQLVARWRGESLGQMGSDPILSGLRTRPLVASQPAVVRRARRRIAILVGIGALAALAMVALPWIGGATLGIVGIGAITSVRNVVAANARFAQHARPR